MPVDGRGARLWQQLMRDAGANAFDIVVVEDIDRISRVIRPH